MVYIVYSKAVNWSVSVQHMCGAITGRELPGSLWITILTNATGLLFAVYKKTKRKNTSIRYSGYMYFM